ncbi:flagellar protein FliT [Halomonas sp. ISL-60]|uniref:flagellar protein FliT n=1 Tax=unclassified Halomonas TaxID=2609666 RepID=UPI001BE97D3A|nr:MULTISPECIES: flagellar protein FliT [unclassified Halomonas]MBT2774542.1 flagellar protein FliT [Halomonas sp. ISL-60]MBT2785901.1 flagellar protein FliT [Halomonas sp. ISL-106]MBT2799191.1 flagellar protein FliT [Halomonas sp. ISL-104]MBT2800383.1 flagellar protein FliT [Halomonas sp. ISL-56]
MSAPTPAHDKSAQQALLTSYETLLSRVEYMHELANAEQWAELIDQRTSYVVLVEQLRELDTTVSLDAAALQRKAELLERILEHDVDIRRRLVSRRDELGKLIEVSQRQRDLHRAYAPQQGPAVAYEADDADSTRSS